MANSATPDRRTLLKTIGAGAAGVALVMPLAGCRTGPAAAGPASTSPAPSSPAPSSLPSAPEPQVPPLLDRAKVDNALARLDGSVRHAMEQTGVPGIAVAVVYHDEVLHARGTGCGRSAKPRRWMRTRCSSSRRCPSRWPPRWWPGWWHAARPAGPTR